MEDLEHFRDPDRESELDPDEKEVMDITKYENALDDAVFDSSERNWLQTMQVREVLASNSGNRTVRDDLPEYFVQSLTVNAEDNVQYTYRNGKQDNFDPAAPVIDVAIYFVPGADKVQVSMLENSDLSKEAPIQKSARWKALTAGNMLVELEVQRDLSIVPVDQTPQVVANRKANQNGSKLLVLTKSDGSAVTISSKQVSIINAFSEKKTVDLESTCIEIDAISLFELITNFRMLIKKEGQYAKLSPGENVRILETMIEDARRLLVRSPILQRVAQRLVIQKSTNTRYGVDTGKMFHTLTTSRGIAGLISQSVGYYSALSGSGDAQSKVKGRFMQMIVFLLSLLNDRDLESLQPSLEKSYDLKADRKSIELTILKVLTLEANGPYTFLMGVLSAFYGKFVEIENTEQQKSKAWDEFLGEAARLGWLLPGPWELLGRETGSWKLEWKKRENSDIFDHFQFAGEQNTVNFIPPLKIHSDALASQEVSAELRNKQLYKLSAKDLDDITLGTPGQYLVDHVPTGERSDLKVKQEKLFYEMDDAAEKLENLCLLANEYSSSLANNPPKKPTRRILKFSVNSVNKPKRIQYFSFRKPQGIRTTGVTSIISHKTGNEEEIAVAWMLNGRKITFQDMIRGVTSDHNMLSSIHESLKEFAEQHKPDLSTQYQQREKGFRDLEDVERLLARVDEKRRRLQSPKKPDEPITRVHFQSALVQAKPADWFWYSQSYLVDVDRSKSSVTSQLSIRCERYVVQRPPIWKEDEGTLSLEFENGHTLSVQPLIDPQEIKVLDSEGMKVLVQEGYVVLLLGVVLAIVVPGEAGEKVVDCLKITAATRGQKQHTRRRGAGPENIEDTTLV